MKAFYIPIALLSIILFTSVAAGSYTHQCTAQWITLLEQCEDYLHEEQWERTQERLLAAQGAQVNGGDCVALVGATGLATGPHLHFELTKDGKYVNPEYYINQ